MTWNSANPAAVRVYWRPYGMDMVLVGDSIASNMVEVAGAGRLATVAASEYDNLNFGAIARPGALASEGVDELYKVQSYGCYCPPNIVVAFGTNDCHPANDVTPAEFRGELERACQQAGKAKRYLFVNCRRLDLYVGRPIDYTSYNEALEDAKDARRAAGYNVKVYEWDSHAAANPSWLSVDGVHPDAAGLAARNRTVCKWVRGITTPYVHI